MTLRSSVSLSTSASEAAGHARIPPMGTCNRVEASYGLVSRRHVARVARVNDPAPPPRVPLLIRVSGVSTLEIGQSRTFHFRRDGMAEEGFVVRVPSGLVAYLNRCPHWYVDLDLGDGRFYDAELDRIYCKNHGALFVPDTGECDSGPCAFDSLEKFAVALEGDDALVTVPGGELTNALSR